MNRVTGTGGVFLRAKDPEKLRSWYKTHLGIDVQEWGGAAFRWFDAAGAPVNGTTVWSVGDGSYFAPSNALFMVNSHGRAADTQRFIQAGNYAPTDRPPYLGSPGEGKITVVRTLF
jgi:hypothetical protein